MDSLLDFGKDFGPVKLKISSIFADILGLVDICLAFFYFHLKPILCFLWQMGVQKQFHCPSNLFRITFLNGKGQMDRLSCENLIEICNGQRLTLMFTF